MAGPVFASFGLLLVICALLVGGGAAGWTLAWCGASFLYLSAVYLFNRPLLLGKRPDGSQAPLSLLAVAPYLLLQHLAWDITRRVRREPAMQEIAPGLWIGRRPVGDELPPRIRTVVDATCEFRGHPGALAGRDYIAVPMLDRWVPPDADLARAVSAITEAKGDVLVHCAFGHGRSALIVAAAMIARGDVPDADAAVARLVAIRPAVALSGAQRRSLARFEAAHRAALLSR